LPVEAHSPRWNPLRGFRPSSDLERVNWDRITTMSDIDSADSTVIALTQRWVERAVVGLNLCPFARAPLAAKRIRYRVSHAATAEGLVDDLVAELQSLQLSDPDDVETTLLIHPQVFGDFLDFNDFLEAADAAVEGLQLEGLIQVASFHPHYQFEGSAPDDIENYSNRAPYPILHLLREASVERAMELMPDTDQIFERNIETLRKLGHAGWAELWK